MRELYAKLIENFGIRYTKKQKSRFIDFVLSIMDNAKVVKVKTARNIVIGDLETAKIVLTAHYDTAGRNIINTRLYYDHPLLHGFVRLPVYIVCAMFSFLRNKHNANDNTASVAMLLHIARESADTCVILFDNEERGMSGSYHMARKFDFMDEKLFVNFDSFAEGDAYVCIYNRGQMPLARRFANSFDGDMECQKANTSRYFSDSDNLDMAVTVTCFKRDRLGHRYVDNIHSNKDKTVNLLNMDSVLSATMQFLNISRI